jgi:outer membrane protein insertion porin family
MRPRPLYYALLLALPVSVAPTSHAQRLANDVQPIVDKIEVKYGKLNNVSEAVIRAHLQVREGTDYNQLLVDRSIRSLYDTGLFDFIQAQTVEVAPQKVNLVFTVQTKFRVQDLTMTGNYKYSRKKLMKKAKQEILPGSVLDEMTVRKACDGIRDFYHKKGYSSAKVDYKIVRNEQTGLGSVNIEVSEGHRTKIVKVRFTGNDKFKARKLRGQIDTARYKWWWSWASGSGRLDEDKLDDDLGKLRDFYKNKGYLDIDITDDSVKIDEVKPGKLAITINIKEGRQYFVGDINVEGEDVMNEMTITQMLKMVPGDPFSPKQLDDDVKSVEDLYGTIGRLEAQIHAERIPNLETGNIDITYHIVEGDEYKIETIKLQGNNKSKSTVLLRELAMRPGQIFNTMWMKASEARLKNTRFFDDVSVEPEPTNIPGRKNLKVIVHEAPTAQVQFGVGYSTTEEGTIYAEYTQGNFDLFNWRSFFQGAGQKFQVSVSLGTASNETVIAFEEPYFMQQRLGLGFELYRRETEFESDYYDTTRLGMQVYMRKRLFERFEGRLFYNVENVKISLVSSSAASSDIFAAEAGSRLVSKVGFVLQRDTRNDLLFTTNGSRISIGTELAGLGGDTSYFKVDARSAIFLPTFETLDQCLALLARAGTAWPLDGGVEVDGVNYGLPLFDRFFLGGSQSLRGFEYHEVGPRDPQTNETIGGNSYGFASMEYTVKLAESFRIALFYDWGFVNIASADWNPVAFNDDWGFGIRLLVMNNPLSLDYALPLNSDDYNDKGGQFNFSFGTRF